MKKKAQKEPVRLREKKLSNGNSSLYLDYYDAGERQYEFLKLYLIDKPKSGLAIFDWRLMKGRFR